MQSYYQNLLLKYFDPLRPEQQRAVVAIVESIYKTQWRVQASGLDSWTATELREELKRRAIEGS
jgi:hypothetical protein